MIKNLVTYFSFISGWEVGVDDGLICRPIAGGFVDEEEAKTFIRRINTVSLYGYNPLSETLPMCFDHNNNQLGD